MKIMQILYISLSVWLSGCASSPEVKMKEISKEAKRTHYTLKIKETVKHSKPLPYYTPIYVEWHYDNGASKSHLAFKAWDMDHDGRYDMIERASKKSDIDAFVFDFDFDGKVDLIKELTTQ